MPDALSEIREHLEVIAVFRRRNLAATCPAEECPYDILAGTSCDHGASDDVILAHAAAALARLAELGAAREEAQPEPIPTPPDCARCGKQALTNHPLGPLVLLGPTEPRIPMHAFCAAEHLYALLYPPAAPPPAPSIWTNPDGSIETGPWPPAPSAPEGER